jgi:hypothetical protein
MAHKLVMYGRSLTVLTIHAQYLIHGYHEHYFRDYFLHKKKRNPAQFAVLVQNLPQIPVTNAFQITALNGHVLQKILPQCIVGRCDVTQPGENQFTTRQGECARQV